MPRRTQEQAARPAGAEGGALWGLQLWKGVGRYPLRLPPHTFNDNNATKTFIETVYLL